MAYYDDPYIYHIPAGMRGLLERTLFLEYHERNAHAAYAAHAAAKPQPPMPPCRNAAGGLPST